MAALTRPLKITFGEMRDTGVRGILIYCSDYMCSHSIAARFVCKGCGRRADVRPDFHWQGPPVAAMGYR